MHALRAHLGKEPRETRNGGSPGGESRLCGKHERQTRSASCSTCGHVEFFSVCIYSQLPFSKDKNGTMVSESHENKQLRTVMFKR